MSEMSDQKNAGLQAPVFTKLVNLASERLGTTVLFANDDFFAEKENLVKDTIPIYIPEKYTERGKWMDGWESRRRRQPGNDYCILRLGLSGEITGVDIDTAFFLGNHPPKARMAALCCDEVLSHEELMNRSWTELLPDVDLNPGSHNFFPINSSQRWTHLRLDIIPDGGVARLRVYGDVKPHWKAVLAKNEFDLIAVENGGKVVSCNDMFFSSKDNLIMPGRGVNMGDGWETKRRRVPGFDWVITQFGCQGTINRIVVDTAHFKGNFPDRVSLEGCLCPTGTALESIATWQTILAESKLQADHTHEFTELKVNGPFTHVRMNIFPDGGVSRLRLFGQATEG